MIAIKLKKGQKWYTAKMKQDILEIKLPVIGQNWSGSMWPANVSKDETESDLQSSETLGLQLINY